MSLMNYFENVSDPRRAQGKRHSLLDILGLTLCAVICGADNWVEIEEYGTVKHEWLSTWLDLAHGIPSHDTISDVFARINPNELEAGFQKWIESLVGKFKPQAIHIDGKTLRGSGSATNGQNPLHLVSAWVSEAQILFGQVKTEDKSNEITAIPALLKLLDIENTVVTIDALGTQTAIATQIVAQKGAYVLALKGNQGNLLADVADLFKGCDEIGFKDIPHDYAESVEKGHGRIERRRCWVLQDREYLNYVHRHETWEQLTALIRLQRERRIGDKTSVEMSYFISSCAETAAFFLKTIRSHWSIENQLHWSVDMAFREDENQTRIGNAQENFALIRRLALMRLKRDTSVKIGIKGKRLRAGWSDDYLAHILLN